MPPLPPVTVPVNVELGGPVVRQYTAAQRILRSIVQVTIGMAVAIGPIIALLPVSPAVAAWAVGIAGAVVLAIVTVQNALEAVGALPSFLKDAVPPDVIADLQAKPPVDGLTATPGTMERAMERATAETPLPPVTPRP